LDSFLVSVDVIETLTGSDFFSDRDDPNEKWLEDQDTWNFAQEYFSTL
jgi:hypothetical protein